MSALTAARNTQQRSGDRRSFDVAAGVIIYQGAQVAMTAAGYAAPMVASTTLFGVGRAEETVDNTDGVDGDETIEVGSGIYRFANSGSDAISKADIGSTCYGEDDQTVSKTDGGGTLSPSGTVHDVDDIGVWVKFT